MICEYGDTPKYEEMRKKKGFCVTKEWVYNCEKKGKRLKENSAHYKTPDPEHPAYYY